MKTSGRKIFLVLSLSLLIVSAFSPVAEAGVLFRNRRNVIRTTQPRFQKQNYKVIRSTAVMKATQGGIFKARAYGGVTSTMKLVKANVKYEEKLAKWELKRFKANKKLEDKRRKIKEKEARQREKEYARKKKSSNTTTAKSLLASVSGSDKISNQPAARGALGPVGNQPNSSNPKQGFWASLWQALLGKRA